MFSRLCTQWLPTMARTSTLPPQQTARHLLLLPQGWNIKDLLGGAINFFNIEAAPEPPNHPPQLTAHHLLLLPQAWNIDDLLGGAIDFFDFETGPGRPGDAPTCSLEGLLATHEFPGGGMAQGQLSVASLPGMLLPSPWQYQVGGSFLHSFVHSIQQPLGPQGSWGCAMHPS